MNQERNDVFLLFCFGFWFVRFNVTLCWTQIWTSLACLDAKYLNLNARVEVDLLTHCLDMGAAAAAVRSRKLQSAIIACSVPSFLLKIEKKKRLIYQKR